MGKKNDNKQGKSMSDSRSLVRLMLIAPVVCLLLLGTTNHAHCQTPIVETTGVAAPQPVPCGWQQQTASLVEPYHEVMADTVISRTCGTSLSVTCARLTKVDGSHYTFVVRDREDGQHYRSFQALQDVSDTVADYLGRLIEFKIHYYVRDVRVADSSCFFCGMKEASRTLLPSSEGDVASSQRVVLEHSKTGFIGRFSLADVITPTEIAESPNTDIAAKDGSSSSQTTTQLPSSVGLQLALVKEASTLDKMWIDEGLYVDAAPYAGLPPSSYCPPFTSDTIYYDTLFTIDSVQTFAIGRLKDDESRSCLVSMRNMFSSSSNYTVKVSPMANEIFYDITGIDARVLLSSRFGFSDTPEFPIGDNGEFFQSDFSSFKTIGVRFKDLYRHQIKVNPDYHDCYSGVPHYLPWTSSDYNKFNTLHLYTCDSRLSDVLNQNIPVRNFGHLCRMKNLHTTIASNSSNNNLPSGITSGELYTNQDFCILTEPYSAGIVLIHINEAMNVVYSFQLNSTFYDHFSIGDVVCVGNTLNNSIAISYNNSARHIDLVDWGAELPVLPDRNLHGRQTSVHLSDIPMTTTSLDMYHNGTMLLAGGVDDGMMVQAAQLKDAWNSNYWGQNYNINDQPGYFTCFTKKPHQSGSDYTFRHESHELGLENYPTTLLETVIWSIPSIFEITDDDVALNCLENH